MHLCHWNGGTQQGQDMTTTMAPWKKRKRLTGGTEEQMGPLPRAGTRAGETESLTTQQAHPMSREQTLKQCPAVCPGLFTVASR